MSMPERGEGAGVAQRMRRTDREASSHYVYQLWSETECLYVGVSCNPSARLMTHSKKPWWREVVRIQIDVHPGRWAGLDAEEFLIESLQPRENVLYTERGLRAITSVGRHIEPRTDVRADVR